jgi:hypothetical protein
MTRTGILLAVLAVASPAAADVVVSSATDASPCTAMERSQNTATLRRTLDTLIASQLPSANAHVDATIVSLTVEPTDDLVVVSAQIRLAISDDSGRILSVLTGGAKVEQSARSYRAQKLGRMRDDAVSAAVEGMFGKVKIAIAAATTTPSWPFQIGKLLGDLVALSRPFPRS